MTEKLRIWAQIRLTLSEKDLEYKIRPKEDSDIFRQQLLTLDEMPHDFYESYGFMRTGKGRLDRASVRHVIKAARVIVPIYFEVSQGVPILWVCSEGHAAFYKSVFNTRADVVYTILRGSLREDNPYPPLVMEFGETGGSNDEHVIMLARSLAL